MRRQLIVNGALLLLALATLSVVWVTRDAPTTGQLEARKQKLFPAWQRERVTRLVVKRDGVEVELVRDASVGVDGDFRIVRPWPERADIAAVSGLLGALDFATFLRSAEGVDRERAGLASARLEISFEQGGTQHRLRLGAQAPAPAGAAYAEVMQQGEPARVVTLSPGVVSELDVNPNSLRDPRLLEVSRHDVARLILRHGSQTIELMQGVPFPTNGVSLPRMFFMRREGEPELLHRGRLERILTALARLVASELTDPEEARRSLASAKDKLVVEVTRVAKAGPPITITLGGACGAAPSMGLALVEELGKPARAGCVPLDIGEALRVRETELVVTSLFSARPDEVSELQLSSTHSPLMSAGGADKLVLKRHGAAFQLGGSKPSEVALDVGNRLLEALLRVEGTRQTARAPEWQDFSDGWARVYLNDEEGLPFELVRFAKPRPDGSVCARRELDHVVICIEGEQAKQFRPDPTLLRSLRIVSFAAAQLTALGIERGPLVQRVERSDDGSFALREPSGYKHDGALVTDAIQGLGALEAERWVASTPRPEHGLDRPWLRARAELDGGEVRELLVGSATSGGYFAKLQEDAGVFVLAREAISPFELLLLDRSLVPVPAEDVKALELTDGTRRLTLHARGGKWTAEGLAPGAAQQLADAALALRAERALHLGPARPEHRLRPFLTFVTATGERSVVSLGARDVLADLPIVYARLSGVPATFALAASTAQALRAF